MEFDMLRLSIMQRNAEDISILLIGLVLTKEFIIQS